MCPPVPAGARGGASVIDTWSLNGDDAAADRILRQIGSGAESQLVHDIGFVKLHRSGRDFQGV